MSMGIGGFCRKSSENDAQVIYEYTSYNLNNAEYRNENGTADGFIEIRKSALKRDVLLDYTVKNLTDDGKVSIQNCTNTWDTDKGSDVIAIRLCKKLLRGYQLTGDFSETAGLNI